MQVILSMILLLLISIQYRCKLLRKINIIPSFYYSSIQHDVSVDSPTRKSLTVCFNCFLTFSLLYKKETQCRSTMNDVMAAVDLRSEVQTITTDFVSSCIFYNYSYFCTFPLQPINETTIDPASSGTNQIMDEILTNVVEMEVCLMIKMNL